MATRKKVRRKIRITRLVVTILFSILGLLWISPVLIGLLVGMKTVQDYSFSEFYNWPKQFYLIENLRKAWVRGNFNHFLFNSFIYALGGAAISVFTASTAAFALTRLKIRWNYFWFILIWIGSMFPFLIYIIPLASFYHSCGLFDKKVGMILVYGALCTPFALFVFRNYFLTIPMDIQEAAMVEGCSNFQLFSRVIMPLAKSPAAMVMVLQFTWIWNELPFGLVLTQGEHARPVMAGIAAFSSGGYGLTDIPMLLSGSIMAAASPVILFIILHKHFIKGITITTVGR